MAWLFNVEYMSEGDAVWGNATDTWRMIWKIDKARFKIQGARMHSALLSECFVSPLRACLLATSILQTTDYRFTSL